MITTITILTLVVGLIILTGGIPKALTAKTHLEVKIDEFHFNSVDRKDRQNPTKSPLAIAIFDTLADQGIKPLYVIAGLSEVRVALVDKTLVYRTSPSVAVHLKAFNSYKHVRAFTATLKLIEVRRDGISPVQRLINLLPA